LNARLVIALSVVVIVLIAAAFLVNMQQGATTSTESRSSTISTGGSYVNSPQNLQLRLTVNASSTGSSAGGVTVNILASEYNTLATANNVSKAQRWGLTGLSLGACGTEAYPFGVALYRGSYTAESASSAQPLQIYPVVACPMLIRYITGYLFQPMSDLAVVLPSGPNATATPMSANVTATAEYNSSAAHSSSSTSLGPGTYTAAAGDEWGSVVLVHFTIGSGGSTSSTVTGTGATGTLEANFSIGPTAPVCRANSTITVSPPLYSSIEAVVTSQPSGQAVTLPISWLSNGCSVSGSLKASLAPGTYSLNLSSCQLMGCSSALPKSFVVVEGQTTSVNISIDTGIR
jgi:hypothetical protein